MYEKIRLEEVTPDNWRLELKVREDQENYVSNESKLLARAYAYRNYGSKAYIICYGETPVGMSLQYECEDFYNFSQFFIDERYQGKGFGYEAARQMVENMRAEHKFDKIYLCYIDGNNAAHSMYQKLGFRDTGERDGDEIIMRLDI